MSTPLAEQLSQELNANYDSTLKFLEDLVKINSYTLNPAGVEANAQRVIQQFEPFGFTVSQLDCNWPGAGKHLVLDSGGEGPVIACIAHLDTVFPPEEEIANNFHWQPDGNLIYGPGTYDMKGGTAMIWQCLSALKKVAPEAFSSVRWLVIWNAAEEVLSPDFGDVCKSLLPANTIAALVFEPDTYATEGLSLVRSRKGKAEMRITVTGRGAHAGSKFPEGANAILQLSHAIQQAMDITDLDRELTVNVGAVSGGSAANRIPHLATAQLEMRAFDDAVFQEAVSRLLALSGEGNVKAPADHFPCQVQVENLQEICTWPVNPQTDALLQVWTDAANSIQVKLDATRRGGLSDGNRICREFPSLDGLGPRGGNAHTSERSADGTKVPEFVDASSFIPKALINCLALHSLCQNPPK